MISRFLIILFFLIALFSEKNNCVYAQHCQYDHYSLIGIVAYSADDNVCVDNLKISLIDNSGNELGIFWRNAASNRDVNHAKNNEFNERYYANALDHYVFVHRNFNWSSPDTKFTIKIEDTINSTERPRFETMLIPLDRKHDNSLCTYGVVDHKIPISYLPLKIQLMPAKETVLIHGKTAPDSVVVISGDIEFNLTKTSKQSGIDNYGNIYGPYETHRLFSMYHARTGQLICTITAPYNSHLACMDSLEVADYNFDGYPDLRFCNPPNYEHQYLLYDAELDTFFYSNILSTLDEIKINESKKLITGTYSIFNVGFSDMDVKIGQILAAKEYYQLSGEGLKQISRITVYYDDHGKSIKIDTAYFTLLDQKLKPITKETYESWSNLSHVKIETSIAQVDSMSIIDGNIVFKIKIVKPTIYSDGGQHFARQSPYRMFEMRNIYTDQLLYLSKQIYLSNMPCMDSIEINDFNFDNVPDLSYCNGYNGISYLVFDSSRNTFILEPFLSKLENIKFNWHDAIVTGEIAHYNVDFKNKYATLVYREYYRFCGTSLKHVEKKTEYYNKREKIVSSKTEYFIYENYALYPTDMDYCFDVVEVVEEPVNGIIYPILILKELAGVRAELTQVLTDQYLPIDSSKQTQKFTIWLNEQTAPVFEIRFSVASGMMDTMEIGSYNFDQIPDILIYTKSNPNQKKYFLSHTNETGVIEFYEDKFMSGIADLKIDSIKHTIRGYQAFGLDSIFYTLIGVAMDTLIIEKKYLSVAGLNDTKTFCYNQNKIVNIDPPYQSPIRIVDGKEFADFNFDGFEDYRILTEREGQYTYYCWDSQTNQFLLHETLSMMQQAVFDWKNKIFLGDCYYTSDDVTISDHYELRDGKIVVTERIISSKTSSDQSEQRYQEIYIWQDGKLVLFSSGIVE